MSDFAKLKTAAAENMPEIPLNFYPRPCLKRDSFMCLNGKWEFEVSTKREIPEFFNKEIIVPYPPESILSGVDKVYDEKYYRFYKLHFSVPEGFVKDRVILHFGAVDSRCSVHLNNERIGEHLGGYDGFSFDITEHLIKNNTLIVKVSDNLNKKILPYGKQRYKRGGMWYTPVSGIWQTVWLESVSERYIKDIKIKTSKNGAEIYFDGIQDGTLTLKDTKEIFEIKNSCAKIDIDNPIYWSPENPHLYYFEAEAEGDKIESYFALRTLEIKDNRLCLNGKPYFFHALLDQGYFPDGIFTPADEKGFENDILCMKSLGFNTLRKHIKIEPQQFYYDCDRLGMIVFQDFVNNSDYSFIRDTALPTVGVKKLSDKYMHTNKKSRAAFYKHMEETVSRLYNHPSICYWTIFNEGWGQFESTKAYKKLKQLDSTRFIDSASGWFKGGESDVVSEHVYFKPFKFTPSDKPTVLSEFGGYSYRPEGHIYNLKKSYGYKFFKDIEEFNRELVKLYEDEIIPAAKMGLSAAVYTQVSDVEDETNGLLSYDRKVLKVNKEKMLDIAEKLKNI